MKENNVLLRLIAAQVGMHAALVGLRMAAPLCALQQGHGPLAVGLLMALFSITQSVLALPAGRYVDRVGLHQPVRWAVRLAGAGGVLAACWPAYPMLCIGALACGAASGLTLMALQRYAARQAQVPGDLKRVFSWLAMGPALANLIGPLMAGLLIDHAGPEPKALLGFQAAFAALAIMPVLSGWIVRTLPAPPPAPPSAPAPGGRVRDILQMPGMLRVLTVNTVLSWCYDVHMYGVPLLGHERGLSASVIGGLLASFALAATVTRMCLPWVVGAFHEYQVMSAGLLLSALALLSYPWVTDPWGLAACSVVLGLALAAVQPMLISTLYQLAPPARRTETLAWRLMLINTSSTLMPGVLGALGAWLGLAVVLGGVGAVGLLGVPMAWRLRWIGPTHNR